jgi:hypothetical protein
MSLDIPGLELAPTRNQAMANKTAIVMTSCVACLYVAPAGVAAQTVLNPSFEQLDLNNDPVDWLETGAFVNDDPYNGARVYTPPTFALDSAVDGDRVYGVVRNGSRVGGSIYQQVSGATPGTRYRASVWLYTDRTGDGEMRGAISIDPTGGTNPGSSPVISSIPVHSDGQWSRLEVDAFAASSTITVFVTLLQSGSTGFAINYVDAVDLVANPPLTSDCGDGTGEVTLDDRRVDLQETVEAQYTVPPGFAITGIGARGSQENVSTMVVRQQRVLTDGDLGEAEIMRFGNEPDGPIEAAIMLPPCHVAVGYGARAAGEFDIFTLAVWARPILADGSLGQIEEFRAGVEPDHALEREYLLEPGRILSGVGLRMQFSDLTGIYVVSNRYTRNEAGFPGDFDEDGDVDQEDFGRFQACYSGGGVTQSLPECREALLDEDDDVDLDDFTIFQGCVSGANQPADLFCDE